jgi:hypothetical protein
MHLGHATFTKDALKLIMLESGTHGKISSENKRSVEKILDLRKTGALPCSNANWREELFLIRRFLGSVSSFMNEAHREISNKFGAWSEVRFFLVNLLCCSMVGVPDIFLPCLESQIGGLCV